MGKLFKKMEPGRFSFLEDGIVEENEKEDFYEELLADCCGNLDGYHTVYEFDLKKGYRISQINPDEKLIREWKYKSVL